MPYASVRHDGSVGIARRRDMRSAHGVRAREFAPFVTAEVLQGGETRRFVQGLP